MHTRLAAKKTLVVSVLAHALLLSFLFGVFGQRVMLAPRKLPGTALGTHQMLVFSMGGAPPAPKTVLQAKTHAIAPASVTRSVAKPAPSLSSPVPSAPGSGSSAASALGDGNITIALVKHHPRPEPDLSTLAQGAGGDVVLDATIDSDGKITQLQVTRSLGASIDKTVIATVQQWTFSPATKDGVPVASEQEILFHYERS